MPTYLQTAGYKVYIWSNEKDEPIHFHLTKSVPKDNDTKIWVLSNRAFKIAHNKSKIPQNDLNRIFSVMEGYFFDFINFLVYVVQFCFLNYRVDSYSSPFIKNKKIF